MTSKIVVNNIEPDAGIGTVSILGIATATNFKTGTTNVHNVGVEAAGINVLGADTPIGTGSTIYNDGGARFSGIVTATAFHGDGSSLTGVGASFGNSSVNTSGIITATAFVSDTPLSHRNLIINGAMTVAQRGSSSTANGFGSVDRFAVYYGNVNEAPTQSQSDVGLSDLPFTEQGITKCFKVTNGNQTSTDNNDSIEISYKCEAQDLRNSGWKYNSSSSFITLSYYVRSSVAQTYTAWISNHDGTRKNFVWSYALSANTWTKITKIIPGDSGLTINNDNGAAFEIWWQQYYGTNYTQASPPGHNTGGWVNHDNETVIDNTATWYETNDATFELTGVQLEVGPVATPFEHRSYGEELSRSQRYFISGMASIGSMYNGFGGNQIQGVYVTFPCIMRSSPTITFPTNHSSTNVSNNDYTFHVTSTGFSYRVNLSGNGNFNRRSTYHATAEL